MGIQMNSETPSMVTDTYKENNVEHNFPLVDLHSESPVIVMPAMTSISVEPAPRKLGPPESP